MARIIRQVTVVRDGQHNAFTDLAFWQGCYWVGYRKGASHVSPDGSPTLSMSTDRKRFREVAHLKAPGDNRDPKLIAMSDDRMAMIFASWVGGFEKRRLQQFITFSADGFEWESPQPILPESRWLWRARKHEGRYYGMTYGMIPGTTIKDLAFRQEFVVSDDMRNWRTLSQIGTDEMKLGEADVHFRPDGEAWVISRSSAKGGLSYFSRSKPPYTKWEDTRLEFLIHCPVLLEHDGTLYVSGRRIAAPNKEGPWPFPCRCSLGIWAVKDAKVEPVLYIPATGDCAYPGLIKDPDGRVCMSYYSQHAYDMGVVSHGYDVDVCNPKPGEAGAPVDDVYFAEIEFP